jgi:hypothetical protein
MLAKAGETPSRATPNAERCWALFATTAVMM